MRLDEPAPAIESVNSRLKIAVAATFTAEPVLESLGFWMRELGLDAAIEFAPYNQVFQELLNPGSLLSQNHAGINVILLRTEDWLRYNRAARSPDQARLLLERNAGDFIDALQTAVSRSAAPFVVVLCPPSTALLNDPSMRSAARFDREQIGAGLEHVRGVTLLDSDDLAAYPVDVIDDPQRDAPAYPVHPTLLRPLGTLVARWIGALKNPPYKVIVLDCDNTIWQGVVGEEGARA